MAIFVIFCHVDRKSDFLVLRKAIAPTKKPGFYENIGWVTEII
ncbi:hypothetical protein [Planktothricoides raciborskii]|nr:hypothetical protein [Planktothricoides raciborskii]